MDASVDADLELLGATARRHIATLSPLTSVHVSAAIDLLVDPLVPPRLFGVDDADTADPATVLRTVRSRLLQAARDAGDVQRTLALGFAARELTQALAALSPDPTRSASAAQAAGSSSRQVDSGPPPPSVTTRADAEPARAGWPGR